MRHILTILLSLFHIVVTGQTIEYRNDSLFVNNLLVDAKTASTIIDSLLDSKKDSKISKDEYRTNPATGKSVVQMTDFYYERGLFFRRYDFDETAFTVGIRMIKGTNTKAETQTGLKESYEGELLIEGNRMNERKTPSQLTNLKNCEVMFRYLRTSSRDYLMQGDISLRRNMITIFFDEDTNDVTSIFISLNLTDN
jgi:hypothetical protein